MVISFSEGCGRKHIKDWGDAHGLLKAKLNRFLKQAGLHPDNIEWYAGLHSNTENTHIHVSFFEREPLFLRQKGRTERYHNGKLRQTGIDGFKVAAEQYFCDTSVKLKTARKEVLAAAQNVLSFRADNKALDTAVRGKLIELAKHIPEKGGISYASENMGIARSIADGITAFILKHDKSLNNRYSEFLQSLQARDDSIREACKRQRIKNTEDYIVSDKTVKDLYRRLGNLTINTAIMLRGKYLKERTFKQGSVKRRVARKSFLKSLEISAWLIERYNRECTEAFEEYLERLEEVKQPQHEREEMCM